MAEKKKNFQDKPFDGIKLSPDDYSVTIRDNYFQRKWIIRREYSELKPDVKLKLQKRLNSLRALMQGLYQSLPDYVYFGKATDDYRREMREIRNILQNRSEITNYMVIHKIERVQMRSEHPCGAVTWHGLFLHAREQVQHRRQLRKSQNLEGFGLSPRRGFNIPEETSLRCISTKVPRVYKLPGQIRQIYLKKQTKAVFVEKKPMNESRYLGVELEFCAPISEGELGLKLLNAQLGSFVHLKRDGSLRPKEGEEAFEIAFLVPEKEFRTPLKKLCDVLAEVGAQTDNRRCGLHVHFDMRKRTKELIYSNLVACQDVLWKLIPPNRRDNEFCRNVKSRVFPKHFDGSREERYKSINAAAYYRHKTLEIRMHEGTVDFSEIKNWLMLLVKVVNHRKKLNNKIKSIEGFKKRFKLQDYLLNYVTDRVNFWSVNGNEGDGYSSGLAAALRRIAERDLQMQTLRREIPASTISPVTTANITEGNAISSQFYGSAATTNPYATFAVSSEVNIDHDLEDMSNEERNNV